MLRMMAQEATLMEAANSKSRRLLAYNETFNCTDVKIGDSILSYKAPKKKRMLEWRGPARDPGIGETGISVHYQGQTFKVARYFVRRRVDTLMQAPPGLETNWKR